MKIKTHFYQNLWKQKKTIYSEIYIALNAVTSKQLKCKIKNIFVET